MQSRPGGLCGPLPPFFFTQGFFRAGSHQFGEEGGGGHMGAEGGVEREVKLQCQKGLGHLV